MTDTSISNDLVQDDGLTDDSNTNQNNRKKHCPTWVIVVCCIIAVAAAIMLFVIVNVIRKRRTDEELDVWDAELAYTSLHSDPSSINSDDISMTDTPPSNIYTEDNFTDTNSF